MERRSSRAIGGARGSIRPLFSIQLPAAQPLYRALYCQFSPIITSVML